MARRNKNLLTAVGDVELQRRYDECLPCRTPQHVADERLGLEEGYTVGLRRLAVRAGTTGFRSGGRSPRHLGRSGVGVRQGSGCLDVYHALEHLSGTGKILYGAETEGYDAWREETKWELLWNGLELIEVRLENLLKEKLKKPQTESVKKLLGYLRWHGDRLTYRERLAQGRSIGSGQVEGACKNMIGKRLKQTRLSFRLVQQRHRFVAVIFSSDNGPIPKKPANIFSSHGLAFLLLEGDRDGHDSSNFSRSYHVEHRFTD